MTSRSCIVSSFFLAAVVSLSVLGTACAEHHSYRVYDPYYNDYHAWNGVEVDYYHRWARENHRDENRDFRKLRPEEQKEYWNWRHSHGDRDRDHDHH